MCPNIYTVHQTLYYTTTTVSNFTLMFDSFPLKENQLTSCQLTLKLTLHFNATLRRHKMRKTSAE